MQNILLVPDSFKGSLSSLRVCEILEHEILRFYPSANVHSIPMADGGEGTVDAYLAALGGERISCRVAGPFFESVDAFYGRLPDGTAVIEMAACAGLPLVEDHPNPALTTTYGVGELIRHAVEAGARKLIIGLGGSATNDMGFGAAAAVGVEFYDQTGKPFVPTGGTLNRIANIDTNRADALLANVEIVAICDINNPLYGPTGAAHIFAPQKGADPAMVEQLDANLMHASNVLVTKLNRHVADHPGAGAAGGMGAGMLALFNAELKMGIDVLLDTVDFNTLLTHADLVITGEGRVDSQTLSGKVIAGVASRMRLSTPSVPLLVLSGGLPTDDAPLYDLGVTAMFSINRNAEDFAVSRFHAEENLAKTMESILRLYRAYDL